MNKSNATIHGKHSERAAIRSILRNSWNTSDNNSTRSNGIFRLVNNADISSNHSTFVHDSSSYTRFAKELAMNRFIAPKRDPNVVSMNKGKCQ